MLKYLRQKLYSVSIQGSFQSTGIKTIVTRFSHSLQVVTEQGLPESLDYNIVSGYFGYPVHDVAWPFHFSWVLRRV